MTKKPNVLTIDKKFAKKMATQEDVIFGKTEIVKKGQDEQREALLKQYVTLMLVFAPYDSFGSGGNNELSKGLASQYKKAMVDAGIKQKTADRYQETALGMLGISTVAKVKKTEAIPGLVDACKASEENYKKRFNSLWKFLNDTTHTLEGRSENALYNSQSKLMGLLKPVQTEADKRGEATAKNHFWALQQEKADSEEYETAIVTHLKRMVDEKKAKDAATAKAEKEAKEKAEREAAEAAKTESGPVETVPVPPAATKPARRTRKPATAKAA